MGSSKDSCSRKPKAEAGFLSLLFLSWMNNLLSTGYKRALKDEDLHELPDEHNAEEIAEEMDDAWEDEVMNAKAKGRQPRLWRAVLQLFPLRQYVFVVVIKHIQVAMDFIFAVLLWFYLKTPKQDSQNSNNQKYAALSAAGISVSVLIRAVFGRHHDLQTKSMAINLKIALIGIIHKKILQSQRYVLSAVTTGHIQNLISSDVQRMEEAYMTLSYFIVAPFTILMSITVLLLFIGWQSLCGMTIIVLLVILSFSLAKMYAKFRKKQAKLTDQRLGTLHEAISGIRAVKTNAWEDSFINLIKMIRR